jgi:Tfp pilus assembly protein PilV
MRMVPNRGRLRGAALIEALLAFLVLALGFVGMAKLQGQLRLNADIARQRSEALRLAQEDMESLRGFVTIAAGPSGPSYAEIVPASATIDTASGFQTNTHFQLERSVSGAAGFRTAMVTVDWTDRAGQAQQVMLQSVIAATPPALSGALSAHTSGQPFKTVRGRSAFVPPYAKDLGNGSSAFKPAFAGTIAFVIDNDSGAVTALCTDVAASVQTQDLGTSDLAHCSPLDGLLLSGLVRVSLASPPDAAQAHDAPLPLEITLALSGGTYPAAPTCISEAQKLVAIPTAGGGSRHEAVPLAATPASVGAASWTELNDRFVAYHCAVTPLHGAWSGRSAVVPQGWTIGTGPNDWRVCRYSADQDGSGAVDQNAEHPDHYDQVGRNLMQQNFLIVKGDQACPAAPSGADAVQVSYATVQHQP